MMPENQNVAPDTPPSEPAEKADNEPTLVAEPAPLDEQRSYGVPLEQHPELFFGLVGAMGCDLEKAAHILRAELEKFNYDATVVSVSDLIANFPEYRDLKSVKADDLYKYYTSMIDAGNELRGRFKTKDALAQVTVLEIRSRRATMQEAGQRNRAYIIRQLKLPEEVECLRRVYGAAFSCVAVYSDAQGRKDLLKKKFNEHILDPDSKEGAAQAEKLVAEDEHQAETYGQNVRDAFSLADFFIRSDKASELRRSIERLLNLVFNAPYVSPTRSEVAMVHASMAALRSVDLSRQVGAAIVARDGRILSTGCNEVPRFGGGQYWEDDPDDDRDFQRGYDSNEMKKRETLLELLGRLGNKALREDFLDDGLTAVIDKIKKDIKGTRLDSLLEFGRAVHAEMAAMDAASVGNVAVRDTDLYCTTFPCHMCTRQIIDSGIRNVFYIEPYPKSAARELYEDSIVVNPKLKPEEHNARLTAEKPADRKVYYIPFSGVAPRRYDDLFGPRERKEEPEGRIKEFDPGKATPRCASLCENHLAAEEILERNIGREVRYLFAQKPPGTQLTLLPAMAQTTSTGQPNP